MSPDADESAGEHRCPELEYDIREVLAKLPADAQPEFLVVRADAAMRSAPVNLDVVPCPKVLLLGDTHHQYRPIRTALAYARKQPFDLIVGEFNRQHLHFFQEAGLANVAWIPSFTLAPCEREPPTNADGSFIDRTTGAAFAGQAGPHHPYRRWLLARIREAGVTITQLSGTRDDAADLYAKSTISLNISLNGDLNLRVFETMAAGGLLLTDRLSSESGLSRLFDEGEHMICFDGPDDVVKIINSLLANPRECSRIARNGRERYLSSHTPAAKRAQLFDLLAGRDIGEAFQLPRPVRPPGAKPVGDDLDLRLAVYELLQELHRTQPSVAVHCTAGIDPRFMTDALDLPRLSVSLAGAIPQSLLNRPRVRSLLQPPIEDNSSRRWDIAVCQSVDLWDPSVVASLRESRIGAVLLLDTWNAPPQRELLERVTSFGLHPWAKRPLLAGASSRSGVMESL